MQMLVPKSKNYLQEADTPKVTAGSPHLTDRKKWLKDNFGLKYYHIVRYFHHRVPVQAQFFWAIQTWYIRIARAASHKDHFSGDNHSCCFH